MPSGRSKSQEEIKELATRIKAGSIVKMFCDFIPNPKDKYTVFAHVDFDNDGYLIFIVNSEVRPLIEHDEHLKQGQILLSKKPSYDFFDHNSYVNCVEVYDCVDLQYILQNLIDYLGELQRKELDEIIAFVKIAQTISDDDREIIIESLSR